MSPVPTPPPSEPAPSLRPVEEWLRGEIERFKDENRWVWDRLDVEIDKRCAAEARLEAVREIRGCLGAGPMDYELFVDEVDEILAGTSQRRAALWAAPQPEPEENACRSCGIDNPVWFAPNEVWNAVMGDHTGFLCPRCFIVRAEASGTRPTAWVLTPEPPASDEPTGRSD